jgi:hypothetical protein
VGDVAGIAMEEPARISCTGEPIAVAIEKLETVTMLEDAWASLL